MSTEACHGTEGSPPAHPLCSFEGDHLIFMHCYRNPKIGQHSVSDGRMSTAYHKYVVKLSMGEILSEKQFAHFARRAGVTLFVDLCG